MSFSISRIIIHNRAPFEHIELSFVEKEIFILNATNGGGKTTILSHIADAWCEMVKKAYPGEFEGKENKYYRFSSSVFNLDRMKPSFVFIRFKYDVNEFDYIDIRGRIDQVEYERLMPKDIMIKYDLIKNSLDEDDHVKYCSETNNKTLEKIFLKNIVTYFPSYRYEQPGYLNDPFKIMFDYDLQQRFSGKLTNPVEVITNLPQFANWLMDVVFDRQMTHDPNVEILFANINEVFSNTLSIKSEKKLSIGIGQRIMGATRIQIVERDALGKWKRTIYPSIFNMSSGENALICLFGEIVRQFDKIYPEQVIQNATGVVLIDEVDKHLHISMQKEILPKLFQLFPNIQFIVSSHSPFVSMGLEENKQTNPRTKIIDLDNGGIITDLSSTRVFAEGYNAMIEKNKQYRNLYTALKSKESSVKLQIVSEGHNVDHIKHAVSLIDKSLLEKLDFMYSEKTGKEQMKQAYETLFNSNPETKYLFVWDCDCDNPKYTALEENNHFFRFIFDKNTENDKVIVGIENLYPSSLFIKAHYPEIITVDKYGARRRIEDFDKNSFLADVKKDTDISHFDKYLPLIEKIKSVLNSDEDNAAVHTGGNVGA